MPKPDMEEIEYLKRKLTPEFVRKNEFDHLQATYNDFVFHGGIVASWNCKNQLVLTYVVKRGNDHEFGNVNKVIPYTTRIYTAEGMVSGSPISLGAEKMIYQGESPRISRLDDSPLWFITDARKSPEDQD